MIILQLVFYFVQIQMLMLQDILYYMEMSNYLQQSIKHIYQLKNNLKLKLKVKKQFLRYNNKKRKKEELEEARRIASNPDSYSYTRVMEAKATIERLEGKVDEEDLPF